MYGLWGHCFPHNEHETIFVQFAKWGMRLDIVEQAGPNNETKIVGVIQEGLEIFENDKKMKRLPRLSKLGVLAAKEAILSANLDVNKNGQRVGLFFGISLGVCGETVFQEGEIVNIVSNNDGIYIFH